MQVKTELKAARLFPARWYTPLLNPLFRVAASGLVPARWFLRAIPDADSRRSASGPLHLEIVSHCWQYSRMAVYQLSSLVLYPPAELSVTMTLFYGEEDPETVALLKYFGELDAPNVVWNWQALPREQLFRREIGRNRAALSTSADWVWFTDCDIIFHRGCLDGLAQALRGRREVLLYPRHERFSEMLDDADPLLNGARSGPRVMDIDATRFTPYSRDRAKGAFQIVHGDVARACGYCNDLPFFQTPSDRWRKCWGDRVFRWLVRSQGVPIEIPGVYQIRHKTKGRYGKDGVAARIRSRIRQAQNAYRTRAARRGAGPGHGR